MERGEVHNWLKQQQIDASEVRRQKMHHRSNKVTANLKSKSGGKKLT